MYIHLKQLMAMKGITIEALAQLLNVHRNTVANKLDGGSEFSYGQAEKIQATFFPEYTAQFIFYRECPANKST